MRNGKVLLTSLSVRTSKTGRLYLAGWLGKSKVIGFEGGIDKYGQPSWDIYVENPPEKPAGTELALAGDRR